MRLVNRRPLRQPDVLAARPLGSLTALEGNRLSLLKLVEGDLRTSRIVKEVLVSIISEDETESLAAYQTFDCAVQSGHRGSFALTVTSWLCGDGLPADD